MCHFRGFYIKKYRNLLTQIFCFDENFMLSSPQKISDVLWKSWLWKMPDSILCMHSSNFSYHKYLLKISCRFFFSKIFKLYFSNYGLHPALSFYIWAWFNIGEFTTVSIIHPLVQMLIYSDLTWFLRRSSRLLTTNDHSKVLLDYFNP